MKGSVTQRENVPFSGKKGRTMDLLIQFRKSVALTLIGCALFCFTQTAQSIVSPTEGGGGELPNVTQRYDFNSDGHPDYVLNRGPETGIWYLDNIVFLGGALAPTLPPFGWRLIDAADFNGDGRPDYALFNNSTRQTAIWYLNNNVFIRGAYGPTVPAGWGVAGVAGVCGSGGAGDDWWAAGCPPARHGRSEERRLGKGSWCPTAPGG